MLCMYSKTKRVFLTSIKIKTAQFSIDFQYLALSTILWKQLEWDRKDIQNKRKEEHHLSCTQTPKEKFTPPSKKLKHKEVVSPETRERAITKLRLISPSANTIEEYYSSICSYLTIKDASNSLSKDYMSRQSDINWKMRAILVDWLVDVHLKFELLPQTFFGCVNLLDRFLSKTIIERSKLQLVGIFRKMVSLLVSLISDEEKVIL